MIQNKTYIFFNPMLNKFFESLRIIQMGGTTACLALYHKGKNITLLLMLKYMIDY